MRSGRLKKQYYKPVSTTVIGTTAMIALELANKMEAEEKDGEPVKKIPISEFLGEPKPIPSSVESSSTAPSISWLEALSHASAGIAALGGVMVPPYPYQNNSFSP